MKYYATIYIDPITDWQGFTHAFLGLTHTHHDELDKQDEKTKQEKLMIKYKNLFQSIQQDLGSKK